MASGWVVLRYFCKGWKNILDDLLRPILTLWKMIHFIQTIQTKPEVLSAFHFHTEINPKESGSNAKATQYPKFLVQLYDSIYISFISVY